MTDHVAELADLRARLAAAEAGRHGALDSLTACFFKLEQAHAAQEAAEAREQRLRAALTSFAAPENWNVMVLSPGEPASWIWDRDDDPCDRATEALARAVAPAEGE